MSFPIISVENLGKRYLVGRQSQRERYTALRDVIARNAKNLARATRGDKLEEKNLSVYYEKTPILRSGIKWIISK